MMRMRVRWGLAAVIAAAFLSQAVPATAQSGRSYDAQTCRRVRGHLVCRYADWSRGTPGTHAYDRWSDGSAAIGGGTAPAYSFPQYLGGHSAWYGFGR